MNSAHVFVKNAVVMGLSRVGIRLAASVWAASLARAGEACQLQGPATWMRLAESLRGRRHFIRAMTLDRVLHIAVILRSAPGDGVHAGRIEFWLALFREQAVLLLQSIRQLGVAEARERATCQNGID